MSVEICGVESGSAADKKRIKSGMELISINGNEINDFLDYRFYIDESKVELLLKKADGKPKKVIIKKKQYDDIGLEFKNYMMDEQRSCANKCIFCFIDQLPPGMRKTLYFKDDDSRLSFLFGNYMTLTNMYDREIERIIKMHISPINISVHTMNPELRIKMMRNNRAGKVLEYLPRLAQAGIKINAQLVLCPGINDGDELRYTLDELEKLYPSLQSVAAVPVGLTDYRSGLCDIPPYDAVSAAQTVRITEEYQKRFKEKYGSYIVHAADEFYLKAGIDIPDGEIYEEYAQLENGVGLWSLLRDEFKDETERFAGTDKKRTLTIATGEAAAPLIEYLVDLLKEKCYNISVNVVSVKNEFFGSKINVAGLLTGSDLRRSLRGKNLGECLIIPRVMLKCDEDVFLDDVTLGELEKEFKTKIVPVANSGSELLGAIIGE